LPHGEETGTAEADHLERQIDRRAPRLPIGADIFADSGFVFCAEFP
jgi:hypothetical protein